MIDFLKTKNIEQELWKKAQAIGIKRRHFLKLLSAGGAATILASSKMNGMNPKSSDFIIIGSGPLGIGAAIRLAEMGKNVLVLESGSANINPGGSHFRNQKKFQDNPDDYFAAIGPFLKPFVSQKNTQLPGLADSSILGGQGTIWTNNCPRTQDFEQWNVLSPTEWKQRYSEAEKLLQVIPNPSGQSNTGRRIQKRMKKNLVNGRTITDLPLAGRLLKNDNFYFNAPWDLLESIKSSVRDRITIQSGINVQRIIYKEDRVTGVETVNDTGVQKHFSCSKLLLAGGAVGTPRLLFNSDIRPDALGRGFSFHALLFGQLILDPSLASPKLEKDLAPRLMIPPTKNKPWHIQVLRDTFPVPTSETVANHHRLLEFQAFLPIELKNANRFIFSDNNQVDLQFAFSENDKIQMKEVRKDVLELASHLGHWRNGGEPNWVPQGTAHLSGTCRMDIDSQNGVTNKKGKVHGFDNLYIASVGLFPKQVAVNPTLTALALALNTVDDMLR